MTTTDWLDAVDPDGSAAQQATCPHCETPLAFRSGFASVRCSRCRRPFPAPGATGAETTLGKEDGVRRAPMPLFAKWLILCGLAVLLVPVVFIALLALTALSAWLSY